MATVLEMVVDPVAAPDLAWLEADRRVYPRAMQDVDMTKAQIDQAYHLVAELQMYAKSIDQYGNKNFGNAMRNAASLLQVMVKEYEATVEGVTHG